MSPSQQQPTTDEIPSARAGLPEAATSLPVAPGPAETGPFAGGRPAPLPGPGGFIPGYELVAELGRGGMGVVYKAVQVGLKRVVAIKVILAGRFAAGDALVRFRTEGQTLARLQHPGIVQVHDIGQQDDRPYLILEYVEGGSLAGRLNGTPWEPRAAAALVATLARTMQAVHEQGIVHRDLKPANVLLTAAGEPKITDFGLAKQLEAGRGLTASGAVLGTPNYMAPEQAGGRKGAIGSHTDVYALGAVLYELITGRPPFQAETALDTVLQVVSEEPEAPRRRCPQLPRDLETICLKSLQKDPSQRYASARELAEDLERFQRREPIRGQRVPLRRRLAAWGCRHPALATGILCVVGQSLLVWLWSVMGAQGRAASGAMVLSTVVCVLVGAWVIRLVFTPPRVRTRVLRGLGVVAVSVALWVSGSHLASLVPPLQSSAQLFVYMAFMVLGSGLFSGVILGLVCGTISVCVRRWVGGTLKATATGSSAGFLAGTYGGIFLLYFLDSPATERVPLPLGIMYGAMLLGALLGAYAGARRSRGRVTA
jgi:serine/threonine protein kinase